MAIVRAFLFYSATWTLGGRTLSTLSANWNYAMVYLTAFSHAILTRTFTVYFMYFDTVLPSHQYESYEYECMRLFTL